MESPIFGIILGFAFLVAISSISVMQFHQNEQFRLSLDAQVIISENSKATMKILGIDCSDPNQNTTFVRVRNSGNEKVALDTLDVYYPDRIPRNDSNRTINLTFDFLDPGLWNPEEEINISIFRELQVGKNYTFSISNEKGITASTRCTP
jgi:hypothetical protein